MEHFIILVDGDLLIGEKNNDIIKVKNIIFICYGKI